MKKLVAIIVLLHTCLLGIAQTPGAPETPKGNGKISGTVIDAANNQPVEFANVALIDSKTQKPIDGSVCDDKGTFTINKIAEGTYAVSITFIGYETATINNIVIDKKGDVSVGIVKLQTSAKVLNEVVVEGQRQLIEEKVDRTVYNAENDKTTAGGDATDVLKRVPMLTVDMDGNVSMRGNQNITVLINNKPSTITAGSVADALKQIPADQIKSVEVITSPSAKYDAEGSAGIINIITKKNTLQGATLNVDAGVGLRGSNLGLNGSYRKGKMGFNLGGFGRAGYNIKGNFENDQFVNGSLNHQEADSRSNNLFGRYTLGWDYDINKNNYLAASVRYGVRNNNNYQDDLLRQSFDTGGTLLFEENRDTETIDESGNIDVSLDFTHTYEKPQRELSFSTQYSRNKRNNDFFNTIYEGSTTAIDSLIKNINNSTNQEMTVQFDYQTPVSTNQMMEFGGKNIFRKVFSDYKYFGSSGPEEDFEPVTDNALTSNVFNYDQNVTSGYFSYTLTTKKAYSIKAGARYEYTTIDANFADTDFENAEDVDTEIPSYGVLVPSVNVSKKLKNGNTLKLAYNRRIQRPSIQFLNPNIQASNPLNITVGNPGLDPEYTNNYELAYSTFIKGTTLNFAGFVRNTTGAIQSVRTSKGDTIITNYRNIGVENAYGMNFFANVNIGSKFSLNGGADVFYSVLDNNSPTSPASNEGWVASGRLFGNYNVGKGWGFQFFGMYRGNRVNLQGSQGGFGMYSLGIKKDFNNKKGSIGFAAENFLQSSMKIRNEVEAPGIYQKSVNELYNMSFRVNVSYRFGKMSFDGQRGGRRKKSVSNDDLKDGGGDGMDAGGGGQQPQQQRGNGGAPAMIPAVTPKPVEKTVSADTAKATVDATGVWNYTLETPQGTTTGRLTIKKDATGYSGTSYSSRSNQETAFSSVSVSGNELTATYTANFGGNEVPVTIKGTITGNDLDATMTFGQFRTVPIKAKKQ
jgi:outer membrane receptor protein involved in Fe transport